MCRDWNPTIPKTPSRMGLLLLGEEAIVGAAAVVEMGKGVVSGLAALAAISFRLRQACRRPPINEVCFVANSER